MNTPLFDALIWHQIQDEEVCQYMFALIGRLFYQVGEKDNFGIIPIIKGDSQTGKSTIVNIIKAMFASSSVDVIDTNLESVFGLQSKYNKELIISHEIDHKFSSSLSNDLLRRWFVGKISMLLSRTSQL